MEEKDLIEKAKLGNKSAMNTLLLDNYNILMGYFIKLTGNEEEAKDIVQETILKAILNIKKFQPKAKFSTWLITIGSNLYKDKLRKSKRYLPLDENYIGEICDVEEMALQALEYKKVMKLLQNLSVEKRAVFILKHFYNYKYEEISKVLNCPIGTVRSRLHNAVKEIISLLDSGR